MKLNVHVRRGAGAVQAFCPDLPGCSASAADRGGGARAPARARRRILRRPRPRAAARNPHRSTRGLTMNRLLALSARLSSPAAPAPSTPATAPPRLARRSRRRRGARARLRQLPRHRRRRCSTSRSASTRAPRTNIVAHAQRRRRRDARRPTIGSFATLAQLDAVPLRRRRGAQQAAGYAAAHPAPAAETVEGVTLRRLAVAGGGVGRQPAPAAAELDALLDARAAQRRSWPSGRSRTVAADGRRVRTWAPAALKALRGAVDGLVERDARRADAGRHLRRRSASTRRRRRSRSHIANQATTRAAHRARHDRDAGGARSSAARPFTTLAAAWRR